MPVRDFEDVLSLLLQVGQGKGHGLFFILPIGVGKVCIEDNGLAWGQDAQMDVRLYDKLMIKVVDGIELDGANLGPILHLDANTMSGSCGLQSETEVLLATEESPPVLLMFLSLYIEYLAILTCVIIIPYV